MKLFLVFASALAVTYTAASSHTAFASEELEKFALVIGQEVTMTPSMRRQLQTSGSEASSSTTLANTDTPTTMAPTTTSPPTTDSPTVTTAPTPPTDAPSTSAPPVTATPTTTAPTPTMAPTPTTAPTTSDPPTTEAPTPSPAPPNEPIQTPSTTTAPPASTIAAPTDTNSSPEITATAPTTGTQETTTAPPTAAPSISFNPPMSAPSDGTTASNSGADTNANVDDASESSMSTGAVVGIVVGIVAAVAIIATIIMCIIRRRREGDDDPLSPFELSMDKTYNPTPNNGYGAQNAYNSRATGAAASGSVPNTHTPPADVVAAGVAYTQFDNRTATSPGSVDRVNTNMESLRTDGTNPYNVTTGTNLWLSAMENKENDSYLSAHESLGSSQNSSRNSYEGSGHNIDSDQSSQISGHSNRSEEFPDHNEDNDSARGSYEL